MAIRCEGHPQIDEIQARQLRDCSYCLLLYYFPQGPRPCQLPMQYSAKFLQKKKIPKNQRTPNPGGTDRSCNEVEIRQILVDAMDVQETELIGVNIMQGYCESVEPLLDKSPYSDFSQSCININKIPFASDLRSEYNCDSKDNSPNPMFLPLYMRKSADILDACIILDHPFCFDSQYICRN